MTDFERGLYVRIMELEKGPHPLPSESGFVAGMAYRVLGVYNASETGEAWLILSNERDELWYISQRHVRTWKLLPEERAFRLAMTGA